MCSASMRAHALAIEMDIFEDLSASLFGADGTVRTNEIDSRPFVPIHRKLQHRSAQNLRTSPPRPKAGSGNSARTPGSARKGFLDRRKDSDKAVTESASASRLIDSYPTEGHKMR